MGHEERHSFHMGTMKRAHNPDQFAPSKITTVFTRTLSQSQHIVDVDSTNSTSLQTFKKVVYLFIIDLQQTNNK